VDWSLHKPRLLTGSQPFNGNGSVDTNKFLRVQHFIVNYWYHILNCWCKWFAFRCIKPNELPSGCLISTRTVLLTELSWSHRSISSAGLQSWRRSWTPPTCLSLPAWTGTSVNNKSQYVTSVTSIRCVLHQHQLVQLSPISHNVTRVNTSVNNLIIAYWF